MENMTIGGDFLKSKLNWDKLPIGSITQLANPKNTSFNLNSYHWVRFQKIDNDIWKMIGVWYVNQTKTFQPIEKDTKYTSKDILNMDSTYQVGKQEYERDRIWVHIPLFKENGDMNVLQTDDFCYQTDETALQLFKEVMSSKCKTYIKFGVTDKNDTFLINFVKDNKTYFLKLTESIYDEFCKKHNLHIRRNSFNTYW